MKLSYILNRTEDVNTFQKLVLLFFFFYINFNNDPVIHNSQTKIFTERKNSIDRTKILVTHTHTKEYGEI